MNQHEAGVAMQDAQRLHQARAAVIVWALFGMDQGVETPPVELPTAEPTDGSSGPGGGE